MKKAISCIVALLMMLSCLSLAEGFSLRNGISFGDSMEDVLAKETLSIAEVEDTVEEKDDSDTDDSDSEVKYPFSIETVKDTVAGVPDSYIVYQFNSEKQLRNVQYNFRSSSYKDSIDNDYNNVNEGLRRKYGKPLGYTNGDCYVFSGQALQGAALVAYLYDAMDKFGDLRDYDEWDVETDDYHVKIEQVEYYAGLTYSEIEYHHQMSYTYFTDEDLQAAKDEKNDRQSSVDNDL